MKKTFSIISRGCISLIAILSLWFIMRGHIGEVASILLKVNGHLLFVAILFILTGILSVSVRLKKILKIQNIDVRFSTALYLTLIGHFFNTFMPTAIGGDILKAYYASKKTNRGFEAFASIFADRFMGLFGILIIAVVALLFYWRDLNNQRVVWAVLFTITVCITAVLAAFHPKLALLIARYPKLQTLHTAIHNCRTQTGLTMTALVITLGAQVLFIFSIYFIAQSLSIQPPIKILFMTLPLIWSLSMLPSINGLGIREGAFIYFLGPVIGREGAFAISLAWLGIFIFGVAAIGGIVYAFHQIWSGGQ